jgi:hypothetical protein
VKGTKLAKVWKEWGDEYELVFGKQSPFHTGGLSLHNIAEWKYNQKKKYDKEW